MTSSSTENLNVRDGREPSASGYTEESEGNKTMDDSRDPDFLVKRSKEEYDLQVRFRAEKMKELEDHFREKALDLWRKACEFEGIAPDSLVVKFSERAPYLNAFDAVIVEAQEHGITIRFHPEELSRR